MAKQGDMYEVMLNVSHLDWGNHRYTHTRERIDGERYLPIPRDRAREFNILNSNGTFGEDIFGKNLFNCKSSDGNFTAVLKAQGCSRRGDIYAKQFSVCGDLKQLDLWYENVDAQPGDIVRVEWISETEIILTLFKQEND